jgi:Uma2 family endonuclease
MALRKQDYLPHYTYEDYKNWEGNWELIYGIPYAMSPLPNYEHQRINTKLLNLFSKSLEHCDKCEAIMPIDWKVSEDIIVQPDVSVICHGINNSFEQFLNFVPSIIVEILSPSTAKKDTTLKYEIYESQGVKYYIIVNPIKKIVEIFQLSENSKYEKVKETADEAFDFELEECNFSLDFKEIW